MDTYRATNTTNGKFYIGSSTNFEERRKAHLRSKDSYPFQNALRKNPEAFEWEVWSDESDEPILEQALLDMWYGKECCYNLSQFADRGPDRTGQAHSETTKFRMREAKKNLSGEAKKKLEETGRKNAEKVHSIKNADGKSLHGVKSAERLHLERDEKGRSVQGVKNAERTNSIKNSEGKSAASVKGGKIGGKKGAATMHAQRWVDPDHPELGQQNAGNLVLMQKRRGLPHGKENRVQVG